MSAKNHLKRAVQILQDRYEEEILETRDWFWNLKNWTINIVTDYDFESIRAYKVKDGRTNWSEYITLKMRSREWVDLV